MLGLPGIPATAVMLPPPTAGPRGRNRMFPSASLGLLSSMLRAAFSGPPLRVDDALSFSCGLPACAACACCLSVLSLSGFGPSASSKDCMLHTNASRTTDLRIVFIYILLCTEKLQEGEPRIIPQKQGRGLLCLEIGHVPQRQRPIAS